jgi:hypothetical protein
MSEQTRFWHYVHRLPWRLTRWVCDLCREFPFDPRKFPTMTVHATTGPPLPVICIDCGKAQTHRVCSACFYGSGGMSGQG